MEEIRPAAEYSAEQTEMADVGSPAVGNVQDIPAAGRLPSWVDFAELLKRNRRVLLMLAAVMCGLVVMVTLVKDVYAWAMDAREKRIHQAVASATPERLIARCGQPSEDTTKEVYPILIRTMIYPSEDEEQLVVTFSRTAEEQSDWVFLDMKNGRGTKIFATADEKIAVLPCLNSRK
jgi:hypothetical protein